MAVKKPNSLPDKIPYCSFQKVATVRQLTFLVLSCTILASVSAGLAQYMSIFWGGSTTQTSWLLYVILAAYLALFPVLPIAAIGVGIGYFAVRRGSVPEARIGRAGTGFVLGFIAGSFLVFFVNLNGNVDYLAGFLGALAGVAAAVMATPVIIRLWVQA